MRTKFLPVALSCALAASLAMAGEGHDHGAPGALPAPPHGGTLAEAAHKHSAAGKEERELFIEVVQRGPKLQIYALTMAEHDAKVFGQLAPKDFPKAEIKIEFPRSKKIVPAQLKAESDSWTTDIPTSSDRRLIAHVTVQDGTETKTAKVQVVKK